MKIVKIGIISCCVAFMFLVSGCTENQRAKSFGGSMTKNLPKGHKLVTATWKESQLWYLSRPMRNDEVPETYEFIEISNFGLMEGKVVFVESK